MAYCTIDQYRRIFPEKDNAAVSDDDGVRQANSVIIGTCLEMASAEMSLYLPDNITEPYPVILKSVCAKIARKELHNRLGMIPQWAMEDYDNAVGTLKSIQSGKLRLSGLSGSGAIGYSRLPYYTDAMMEA